MTTPLQEWCDELGRWLPTAQALIAEPDSDGTRTHTQPTSRPPWNGAVAAVVLTIHEGVPRLEASVRRDVAGHLGQRRGGSDRNTQAALEAIGQLGYALPQNRHVYTDERGKPIPCPCAYCRATRIVARWVTALQQLPAIDEAERWQRVPAPCPYCGFGMLRVAVRSGKVACLRFGSCTDTEGRPPTGVMGRSAMDGSARVFWSDGLVT